MKKTKQKEEGAGKQLSDKEHGSESVPYGMKSPDFIELSGSNTEHFRSRSPKSESSSSKTDTKTHSKSGTTSSGTVANSSASEEKLPGNGEWKYLVLQS